MSYQPAPFTRRVIAATTDACLYPAPSPDGTPVLPIVVHPTMIADPQPFNGPRRIVVRAVAPPDCGSLLLCGYLCAVNSDGSLTRVEQMFANQPALYVDGPGACVIEKVDTAPYAVAFELDGFPDTTTVSD